MNEARRQGVSTELFPDAVKMKKQMSYANAHEIPYVALAGENEMKENKITLKDMRSGEQKLLSKDDLIPFLLEQK